MRPRRRAWRRCFRPASRCRSERGGTPSMQHAAPLAKLIDALRALPGVGPKTAQRMAFHLLQGGRGGARTLAEALTEGLGSIHRCQRCRMLTDTDLCSICAAPARDAALLCVVESPADVVAVEQSGSY